MKWKRLSISAVMLMCALHMTAGDSIDIKQSKYEKRMQRMQNTWAALIPSHYVIQNAGNMGIVSIGTGWSYGKHRQWETDLLFGYIPQHESTRGKLTMTVKENYIPWDINLSPKKSEGKWQFEPLTASLYLNTVYLYAVLGHLKHQVAAFINFLEYLNSPLVYILIIPDTERLKDSRSLGGIIGS